jgi:hypothetical protein
LHASSSILGLLQKLEGTRRHFIFFRWGQTLGGADANSWFSWGGYPDDQPLVNKKFLKYIQTMVDLRSLPASTISTQAGRDPGNYPPAGAIRAHCLVITSII